MNTTATARPEDLDALFDGPVPEPTETARYHDTLMTMQHIAGDLADVLAQAHADPDMRGDPPERRGAHQDDIDRLVRVLACGARHLRTRTKWFPYQNNPHNLCECPACKVLP